MLRLTMFSTVNSVLSGLTLESTNNHFAPRNSFRGKSPARARMCRNLG